jgi:glutaredoxin
MTELINHIINYQNELGTESDPQLIIFTLSGCPICTSLVTDLMIDGYTFEEFDCNKDEHSSIADYLEDELKTNHYPIICITYPEKKMITTDQLNQNKSVYDQIIEHLI